MKYRITLLRYVGISEGISFLVLLLVAMPLKYYFGWPMAVSIVGWMHGVFFMTYILAVFLAIKGMRWNWLSTGVALAASFIPGATFVLDKSWKNREEELLDGTEEV